MARTKAEREQELFELRVQFNDYVLRELGLDIDDDNYVYDIEREQILQINGKFIKYTELITDSQYINKNKEIELNCIENAGLTEILAVRYIKYFCEKLGISLQSVSQECVNGDNGYFSLAYISGGNILHKDSDCFTNESLRIFNLVCKLNKTERLYVRRLPIFESKFGSGRK